MLPEKIKAMLPQPRRAGRRHCWTRPGDTLPCGGEGGRKEGMRGAVGTGTGSGCGTGPHGCGQSRQGWEGSR